jgi:hypothetical protein
MPESDEQLLRQVDAGTKFKRNDNSTTGITDFDALCRRFLELESKGYVKVNIARDHMRKDADFYTISVQLTDRGKARIATS